MKEKFDSLEWITTEELAQVLGIKIASVQKRFCRGDFPNLDSRRVGRRRLYRKADVRDWVLDRLIASVNLGLVTFADIL